MANIRLYLSGSDINTMLRRGVIYCDTVQDREDLAVALKKSGDLARAVLVKETKKIYAYTGEVWEDITPSIDMTKYVTNETLNQTVTTINTKITNAENKAQQQNLIKLNFTKEENRYIATAENGEGLTPYLMNLMKFLNMSVYKPQEDLDLVKQIVIKIGTVEYSLVNILTNKNITMGDLVKSSSHDEETGYTFVFESTLVKDTSGNRFAIVPAVSSDGVISITEEEKQTYKTKGGLPQGQLAFCNGALYEFITTESGAYDWALKAYSKTQIDALIGDIGTILDNINGEVV